ncbi:hypothetical protein CMV_009674 [Castanea mollissima]|uniref:Bulb-type lectin domain-containing protein n=1 Tax=Castanea mollissima TaxID=60419 RepID=A0A8J4VQP9_9ROSI|nr:hypothetical protein CMV_009674 [Castanea mollissima]
MLFMKPSTNFFSFFISSNLYMGYCLLFLTIFLVFPPASSLSSLEYIYPNFTASEFQHIDSNGVFLSSRNGTFAAAFFSPGAQQTNFYLCIIHMASNAIIWSANRDAPISSSGIMNLTTKGITVSDQYGNLRWSTPPLQSSVYALLLTEVGNLVLLDHSNRSLWESFHYPTDTIVIGQHLPVGMYLSSAASDYDLSSSIYNFTISTSDALLQWHGQTYWKLSMDTKAFIISNYVVKYMAINKTGLFLLGRDASEVVIQVSLPPADFRIGKLGPLGRFTARSFSDGQWEQEFSGPDSSCRTPSICGQMGLCTDNSPSVTPICSCPSGFHAGSQNMSGCVPSDDSQSLPLACNSTNNGSQLNSSVVSFLGLGYGIDYFSNDLSQPLKYGVNLTVCQDLCSGDCSCLGIFYGNSSGSCYMLENELGSFTSSNSGGMNLLGYIKVSGSNTTTNDNGPPPNGSSNRRKRLHVVVLVLLPSTSILLLVALGFLIWMRWKLSKTKEIKLGGFNSQSSEDLDAFYIPGLPKRFDYEELEVATDKFSTQIGSGGFGSVYKGTLPDKSVVAIKKITNLGIQGRKEFCTEIALVKNTFLKTERTLSRKVVEMVLALALERIMSKRRILSCYMNKIYWGHGIYGIKSASIFYFGKHPSLLSLGESAMLAGIIPAPELRSPLRDPSRGKSFQARVLRRMVEVGFLDIETALLVVKQGLRLPVFVSGYADGLLHLSPLPKDGLGVSNKLKRGTDSAFKVVWDWEKASVTWEAWEDMERWSIKLQAIDHIKLQKNILVVVTKWIFSNK